MTALRTTHINFEIAFIFKVKNKVITVCGQNLSLKVLSENTLSVIGEIKSVEAI